MRIELEKVGQCGAHQMICSLVWTNPFTSLSYDWGKSGKERVHMISLV